MITLLVEAVSGHYRIPGKVGSGELAPTYPIAPPSTIQGFLESMAGCPWQSFKGSFFYGWEHLPRGRGRATRRVTVWSSPNKGRDKSLGDQGVRCINLDILYDISYIIVVNGEWEQKLRDSLAGKISRTGILYLGESSDLVNVFEIPNPPEGVLWVTPGASHTLPVKTGRGYDNISVAYRSFDIRRDLAPNVFSA